MALVTFRNILDETSEFIKIDKTTLIEVCCAYARPQDDELYNIILNQKVCIYINNEIIPPDLWFPYEVKEDDKIIITPQLEGGKNGGFLNIVLGIVLIVVGIIAEYNPALITAGIGMILGGVSALIFQPDLPTLPSMAGSSFAGVPGSGSKSTQTYNWSGIKSTATYDTPVPIVYGTHRIGGNIISIFTDIENQIDNYLYLLISLGEGEIEGICQESDFTSTCSTSDRRESTYRNPAIEINEQPLKYYDDVEWWYRTGTAIPDVGEDEFYPYAQNKIPYFDSAISQFDDGRELTTDGIEYTTTKEVDMAKVMVRAPSLYKQEEGRLVEHLVYFKVEYRVNGELTWRTLLGEGDVSTWTPQITASPGNPNHIIATYKGGQATKYYEPGEWSIKINGNEFQNKFNEDAIDVYNTLWYYEINLTITNTITGESTTSDLIQTYIKTANAQTKMVTRLPEGAIIDGNRILVPSTTGEDGYSYHSIDEYTFWETEYIDIQGQHSYGSFDLGDYTIQVTHMVRDGDTFTISGLETVSTIISEWVPLQAVTNTGVWNTMTLDFNHLSGATGFGIYDLKVSRQYKKSDDINIQDDLILHSVQEIVQGNFIYPYTALLGLKIKATGQLSGGIPSITTTIKGVKVQVPDFTEGDTFDSCFYDATEARWEDSSGDEVTWDEETYTTEWTNNSMLCVRDMMINTRYGIGQYLTTNDLYTTGILTAIKTCHTEYNPYSGSEPDYFDWWDHGQDSKWVTFWSSKYGILTGDNSSRTITSSDSYSYHVELKTTTVLPINTSLQLSITLADTSENVSIKAVGYIAGQTSGYLLGETTDKGDGTHSISFTNVNTGLSKILLLISSTNSTDIVTFVISDVSLSGVIRDHFHTFDGVLESGQAALTALLEICESFRCWPVWYSGKFNFVLDTDGTPVHTLTMSNIVNKSFKQTFTPLTEIPYRLIGQFTDRDNKYNLRSIIAKASNSTLTKANEQTVGLKGLTTRYKSERELKFKLNRVINCTHAVTFKCGIDYIRGTAGDIINVQHDVPSWGSGGRILNASPTAKTLTLENTLTISNAATETYLIKYQTTTNSFVTATINTASMGNGTTRDLDLITFPATSPKEDAVYAAGTTTLVKPFRVLSLQRENEQEVEIKALEHLSSLYTEDAITIIDDNYSNLPNMRERPKSPNGIFISALPPTQGMGLYINVSPSTNLGVLETVIQMSANNDSNFVTIGTIPTGQNLFTYINPSLLINHTYYFKLFYRTATGNGDAVYTTYTFFATTQALPAPTGIHLKNSDGNDMEFEGKHVHIIWNPIEVGGSSSVVAGYIVEIYHQFVSSLTLLRSAYTTNNEYIYTLDENIYDATDKTPKADLVFLLYTRSQNGAVSGPSSPFVVSNPDPATVTGLTASSIVGGVRFLWTKSAEDDHKNYYYRIKVSSGGTWSDWANIEDNTLVYTLSATEIASYGTNATVYIEVKDKDFYEQLSTTAVSANANANAIADNIFQLIASTSVTTASLAELYDGTTGSGGINF